jgi:hypothetical protein
MRMYILVCVCMGSKCTPAPLQRGDPCLQKHRCSRTLTLHASGLVPLCLLLLLANCPFPPFFPQPDAGKITSYRSPGGPGIRLDGALSSGNTVSRHYDSLVS